MVVVNLSATAITDEPVGMPRRGLWRVRFNSDAKDYDNSFTGERAVDVQASGKAADGQRQSAALGVGPYGVVILSQDE